MPLSSLIGRSLRDLLDTLGEIHAKHVDLYLRQQGRTVRELAVAATMWCDLVHTELTTLYASHASLMRACSSIKRGKQMSRPMRSLAAAGTTIREWPDVKVVRWNMYRGGWDDITTEWNWSFSLHQHYELSRADGGSYWMPTSTSRTDKPFGWVPLPRRDAGKLVYHPHNVYIWIPHKSIPPTYVPGVQIYNPAVSGPPTLPPGQLR
jgi:hypothetical protein